LTKECKSECHLGDAKQELFKRARLLRKLLEVFFLACLLLLEPAATHSNPHQRLWTTCARRVLELVGRSGIGLYRGADRPSGIIATAELTAHEPDHGVVHLPDGDPSIRMPFPALPSLHQRAGRWGGWRVDADISHAQRGRRFVARGSGKRAKGECAGNLSEYCPPNELSLPWPGAPAS
jgi:hypothetical protein